MDQEDFDEALYEGACATMKTRSHSSEGRTVPSDQMISKLKYQIKRVMELLPDHLSVRDIRELCE